MRHPQIDPLAGALLALAARVQHGPELPSDTAERLRLSLALAERDLAVREAAVLVNPEGERSAWAVAGDLAARLSRFELTGWPRICRGAREPSGALERCFCAMLEAPSCPRTPRKLVELIR